MKIKTITTEIKHSLNLAVPLILSFLVQALTPFLGTLMIAHMGQDSLAARGLGSALFNVLTVFFFSMFGSISILVSQSYGAKDPAGVKEAVSQGFKLAIFLTIPIMIMMWIAPLGLRFTHQSPKIIHLSTMYTWLISLAVLPYNFLIVIEQFLIGIQKTKIVLIISVLQVPLEVLSLYTFIFGKFGMPRMGVMGIGISYLIVWIIASAVLVLYISWAKSMRQYHVLSNFWEIRPKFLKELFRIGWPIGINNTIETGMFSTITLIMGWLSTVELAAYQIARQFAFLVLIGLFAIVRATIVRVGQAVGMKDRKLILLSTYVNVVMTFILVLVIGGVLLIFSKQVIGIDINIHISSSKSLFHYSRLFLFFIILSLVVESIRLNIIGALRGIKDTRFPMYVSFIALWLVGLPTGYLFAFYLHLNGAGLLIGGLVGFIVAMIILVTRFHYLVKRVDLDHLVTRS